MYIYVRENKRLRHVYISDTHTHTHRLNYSPPSGHIPWSFIAREICIDKAFLTNQLSRRFFFFYKGKKQNFLKQFPCAHVMFLLIGSFILFILNKN